MEYCAMTKKGLAPSSAPKNKRKGEKREGRKSGTGEKGKERKRGKKERRREGKKRERRKEGKERKRERREDSVTDCIPSGPSLPAQDLVAGPPGRIEGGLERSETFLSS